MKRSGKYGIETWKSNVSIEIHHINNKGRYLFWYLKYIQEIKEMYI